MIASPENGLAASPAQDLGKGALQSEADLKAIELLAPKCGETDRRESMRLIERMIRLGLNIRPDWLEAINRKAMEIVLTDKDPRNRLVAGRLVTMIHHKAVDTAVKQEMMDRGISEAGSVTIGVQVIIR